MLDDELQKAASDLRTQVNRLQPPAMDPKPELAPRLILVAASIAVFVLGVLLVSSRSDETLTEPADPSDENAADDNSGGGDDSEDNNENTTDGDSTDEVGQSDVDRPSEPFDLVTDRQHRPASSIDRPVNGETVGEPEFDTAITAITGADANQSIAPIPGSAAVWNADGSRLFLYERSVGGSAHVLYDGRTFQRIGELDVDPVDVEELYWDPADASRLYYLSDGALVALTLSGDGANGRTTVSHQFDGCDVVDSKGVARPFSNDGRRAGFRCIAGDDQQLLGLDLESGQVVRADSADGATGPVPTPDGRGYVVRRPDRTVEVLDLTLEPTGVRFTTGADVFVLIATEDGRQLYVTTIFDQPQEAIGSVVGFDLRSGLPVTGVGEANGFPYPPSGTRLAAATVDNGLVVAAILGQVDPAQQDTLDGEVILVDFNRPTPQSYRLGHHRGTTANVDSDRYWSSPTPGIDPSGRRILFSSDWGQDRVDSFVIDLDTSGPAD